ncbi:NigD-like protein [Alloprevotella rava]|uniref:NigD-like C-terminal beta sandwich domain-containing protein n=1 Tax=Alloprevotella rava TaxID=671218 RepID=A0A7W5UID3_9BACT|nr:NigD-like protein [Alloprevotella rava]MBB3702435.1 hypothetical protein [Alloprevotella rava]
MKRLLCCAFALAALLSALSLHSCTKDDDFTGSINYPNALVTIKTNSSTGQVYFQLDDSTTVLPTNSINLSYAKKELRALVNLKMQNGQSAPYSKSAYVNWIDTIRTKEMAPSLGQKDNETYGKDPVEIVKDWTTIVEDGYITLRFRTYFNNGKKHVLNLVKGENPYEVILHHNAMGDTRGLIRDGLVAFRLSDLPDTQGKTVDLTLKWQSFSGIKSVRFKYKSRK